MTWTSTDSDRCHGSAILATALVVACCVVATPGAAARQATGDAGYAPTIAPTTDGSQATVRLTLADAISRGMEASHQLAEGRAREAAAQASLDGQSAEKMPQVGVQAGYQRTAHVEEFGIAVPGSAPRIIYPDIPDNLRTRLDFQWPVYTAGRVDALARAARAERDAVGRDLAAARNDLRLEITRAFWALVTARESERVVAQALANVDAHLQDVQHRQAAGFVPPSDVLSTQALRSRQQVLLIRAQHATEAAAMDLRRLTGLEPGTPVEADAVLDQPPAPAAGADVLVGEARRARADRQAIEIRLESLAARGEAAKAGKRPIVGLGAGFDYARPNPKIFPRENAWKTFWDVGVNFSWTFWDGGRVAAAVAQAEASRTALVERLREYDRVLDEEVRLRLLELDSAHAEVAAAADGIRAATEARRVVEERFKAGVAINTEVLDAQQALLEAELDRTRALADVRLAEARLDRAIGK
jgi:outer membrane protein TolC